MELAFQEGPLKAGCTGLRVKPGEIIMENRKESENYLPESQSGVDTGGKGVCLVESISKNLWLTQRSGEGLERKLRG